MRTMSRLGGVKVSIGKRPKASCESRTSVASLLASSVESINGVFLVARWAQLLQVVLDLGGFAAAKGLLIGGVLEFAVLVSDGRGMHKQEQALT